MDNYPAERFISYDPVSNTLSITLPKDLKVQLNTSLNLNVLGEFNISSFGMNLLSLFSQINIDSHESKIFLNSQRSKQLQNIEDIAPAIEILPLTNNALDTILNTQQTLLHELQSCLINR